MIRLATSSDYVSVQNLVEDVDKQTPQKVVMIHPAVDEAL